MRLQNKHPPKVDVYLADDGWRWRLIYRNGRVRAESGEAYSRRADCVRAYEDTMVDAPLTVDQE